jgi:hypothetical protein
MELFRVLPALVFVATLFPVNGYSQSRDVEKSGPAYLGCWRDDSNRVLEKFHEQGLTTNSKCIATCREKGFAFAGTQYSNNCFCGNSYDRLGKLDESQCNSACAGNSAEKCGGPWANSVYSTGIAAPGGGSPPTKVIPSGADPTPTGDNLPMPPYGTPEPATNAKGMTLQGSQRRVRPNEVVNVPFFLINGANLANMNFEVLYNLDVVKTEGQIAKGNLLDNALLSSNPKVGGLIRAGFAQRAGVSGTGTVMNVPFRAVGKPGDSTRLHLVVTTINTPEGTQPTIHRIPGEIAIVDKDGNFPPKGGGGGPGAGGGPGTGGPGGPGTGGPGTGGPGGGGGLTNGDCDGDGRLTALDARCALEMSVQLTPVQIALDMDDSKDVTSRDATLILQRAVGR